MSNVVELTKIWSQVDKIIKSSVDENIYDNFFSETYLHDIRDNNLILVVSGSLLVELYNIKYKNLILNAIKTATETDYGFSVITKEEVNNLKSEALTSKKENNFFKNSLLNPDFTFEKFVKGDSNRDASQAALLAASNTGLFNPLFIYSNSGLGKTHLLHAIGNYVISTKPLSKVLCVTADDFINEYIKAARGEKNIDEFRDYCQNFDVFLLDDIQFMKGSEKCQECFYLIFNELDKLGKQIVITSDRNPNELNGIQDRLVTRFGKGLTVTIKEPDKETALAILKKKIEAPNMSHLIWDELALSFIADKFNKTVRDLEGILNKMIFESILKETNHITIELVASAISSMPGLFSIQDEITEQKIINLVADYFNLSPALITGNSHTRQIVIARHVAMYLIRYELDTPLKKIGQAFGGRDHSTVISGVNNVEKMLKNNTQMQSTIKQLKSKISKH